MLVTAYETENKAINKRPIRSNNVLLTLAIKLFFIVIIFTVIYEVTWCATNHAQQTMNLYKAQIFSVWRYFRSSRWSQTNFELDHIIFGCYLFIVDLAIDSMVSSYSWLKRWRIEKNWFITFGSIAKKILCITMY